MTYLYEYKVQGDTVKVEYCFSVVSDSIKVVDMWVNEKFHRVNWMSHEGRDKLMARLEDDMTNNERIWTLVSFVASVESSFLNLCW